MAYSYIQKCGWRDSNSQGLCPHAPQACAYTNSATSARFEHRLQYNIKKFLKHKILQIFPRYFLNGYETNRNIVAAQVILKGLGKMPHNLNSLLKIMFGDLLSRFTVMQQLYVSRMGENVNLLVLISSLENEI